MCLYVTAITLASQHCPPSPVVIDSLHKWNTVCQNNNHNETSLVNSSMPQRWTHMAAVRQRATEAAPGRLLKYSIEHKVASTHLENKAWTGMAKCQCVHQSKVLCMRSWELPWRQLDRHHSDVTMTTASATSNYKFDIMTIIDIQCRIHCVSWCGRPHTLRGLDKAVCWQKDLLRMARHLLQTSLKKDLISFVKTWTVGKYVCQPRCFTIYFR